jgi:hypothetical protein
VAHGRSARCGALPAPVAGLFETRFGAYDHDRENAPVVFNNPRRGDAVVFLLEDHDDSQVTWSKASPWAFQTEWDAPEVATQVNLGDPFV